MKKRTVHYVTGDENEYDEILTICGIFIANAHSLRFINEKAIKKRGFKISPDPVKVNCKKCMKTDVWKEAIAKKFVDRMIV